MTMPLIVAEIGAAHNGDFYRAQRLIDEAAAAGAGAVKMQTWSKDRMAAPGHIIADGPWKGRELAALYREAWTPWEWQDKLFKHARALGMIAFSTPFDRESVDFLETIGCPMYKIASAEIVDLPLIRYAASKDKSMVISTGMATYDEVCDAIDAAGDPGELTLLKCTSSYPADAEDVNLRAMSGFPRGHYGLSDHTLGSAVAVAATVLGASMIEKHIGLDRVGLDGGFCALPHEFAAMVHDVRTAVAAMGAVRYGPLPSEASTLALRRSLWVVRDVMAGDPVSDENVRSLRPAGGMAPGALAGLVGEAFARDVKAGTALAPEMLS